MNCWTAEAISTYAKASMEAWLKIRSSKAMYVAPGPAARSAHEIDLRRDPPPLPPTDTRGESL